MLLDHDGPAVIAGDRTLSYADLRAAPPPAEDPAEVLGTNTPEFVLGLAGAWNAGATAVPLNGRLRDYELARIRSNLKRVRPGSERGQTPLGSATAQSQNEAAGGKGEVNGVRPRLGLTILYTSGSTGEPKGAYLTREGAEHWARTLAGILELTPEDRVGLIIPMSHAFGLATLLCALYAGAAVVLIENERALKPAELTVLNGSPAVFAQLPPLAIRGLVGGAAAPPEVYERHPRLLNVYGMTEIGGAAVSHPSDPAGPLRPVEGYEFRIEQGEIHVKGKGVTPGYHGGAVTGEWFATGDLGELDDDGRLTITGRASDVIHVGGFNVFPAEVENFLLTHPDVTQAAVVGAPHPRMGQVVKAFVVADATPVELIRFARANIAGYKVPYGIEIVDELPRLPNGKVDKKGLQ